MLIKDLVSRANVSREGLRKRSCIAVAKTLDTVADSLPLYGIAMLEDRYDSPGSQ